MNINLIAGCYGIIFPYILKYNNVLVGIDGVNYYAEVHTSYLNSIIHTIFMPFTIYGILLWVPRLCSLNLNHSIRLQQFLYTAYMTHYMLINFTIGILTSLYYILPLYAAKLTYLNFYNKKIGYTGFKIMTVALLIQEVFGHWIGCDNLSRFEGVPNAILYAMYYSVHHLFV